MRITVSFSVDAAHLRRLEDMLRALRQAGVDLVGLSISTSAACRKLSFNGPRRGKGRT